MWVRVQCPKGYRGAIAIELTLSEPCLKGNGGCAIAPQREVQLIEVLPSVQRPEELFVGNETLSIMAVTAALNRPER
jgi:hypothetical protein